MATTESKIENEREFICKMKFNWPPTNVVAEKVKDVNGYRVTMPDGKKYYVASELFYQLFTEVSPEEADQEAYTTAKDNFVTDAVHLYKAEQVAYKTLRNNVIIDAGLKCLNKRWRPMVVAESISEMKEIYTSTTCALCRLHPMPPSATYLYYRPSMDCSKCKLHDTGILCCWEYDIWYHECHINDNYNKAKYAAKALCRRIEEIVRNAGGNT